MFSRENWDHGQTTVRLIRAAREQARFIETKEVRPPKACQKSFSLPYSNRPEGPAPPGNTNFRREDKRSLWHPKALDPGHPGDFAPPNPAVMTVSSSSSGSRRPSITPVAIPQGRRQWNWCVHVTLILQRHRLWSHGWLHWDFQGCTWTKSCLELNWELW